MDLRQSNMDNLPSGLSTKQDNVKLLSRFKPWQNNDKLLSEFKT